MLSTQHKNPEEVVPDDRSTQKFSEILKSNGIFDEIAQVTVMEPTDLHEEHKGSSCVYVNIIFKNQSLKSKNLFVKKFPDNVGHTKMLKEFRVMEKEAEFFNKFIPAAKEFCRKFDGCENLVDFFPKCFYADEEMIVLQNAILEDSFTMLPKDKFQDLHTTKLVLGNLAKYHAVSFAMIKEVGTLGFKEKFPLVTRDIIVGSGKVNPLYSAMWGNGIITGINILKGNPVKGSEAAIETLSEYIGKADQVMLDAHSSTSKKGIYGLEVLLHGDCWSNNLLFKVDSKTGIAFNQIFVDLQCTRINSPSIDIAFYLYTTVQSNIRRECLQEVLRHYFDSFQATLTRLNAPANVTYEEFFQDYKNRLALGMLSGVMAAPMFYGPLNDVDTSKISDGAEDMAKLFNEAVHIWVHKYPDQAAAVAENIVGMVHDFVELTS